MAFLLRSGGKAVGVLWAWEYLGVRLEYGGFGGGSKAEIFSMCNLSQMGGVL